VASFVDENQFEERDPPYHGFPLFISLLELVSVHPEVSVLMREVVSLPAVVEIVVAPVESRGQ
jgi:hypothetical protein